MMDDTIKYPYCFTITPLHIEHRDKAKIKSKKKILIKLGSNNIKFDYFDVPLTINADIQYSRIMEKFYPLKGIIKVYDVTQEGNQIISSVGAFQTDDLLNENKNFEIIEKELGSTLIKLKIEAKVLTEDNSTSSERLNVTPEISEIKNKRAMSREDNQSLINKLQEMEPSIIKKESLPNFSKLNKGQSKVEETEGNRIPLDQSSIPNQSFSNMSLTCPELFEEYQKKEMELLGEELIEERRKNRLNEENIEKLTLKVQTLRKKLKEYENYIKSSETENQKFLSSLEVDWKGEYLMELNQRKSTLTLLYKKDVDFQYIFGAFLAFISNKVFSQKNKNKNSKEQNNDFSDVDQILDRIEEIYAEKARHENLNHTKSKESIELHNKIEELNLKLHQQQFLIQSKANELDAAEKKIEQLSSKVKNIEEVNTYLKDKDQQMEYILSTKDNSIENLRKMLANVSGEMDEVEEENLQSKKKIRNMQLQIEELKEQISNREEEIEKYAEKYGKMKKPQTRDIENEINDCLRWISQENKIVVESSIDETVHSEIYEKNIDYSVESILRNTEKMASLEMEQLLKFRKQLTTAVKMADELIMKSSQAILESESDICK